MKWKKHGLVWEPDHTKWWSVSHATCPTPLQLDNGLWRVYVQSRDKNNVGRIGYFDLDPDNPLRVVGQSESPVIEIGSDGTFDDSGVFQTSIIRHGEQTFLYYVGFELGLKSRYRLLTGLAIGDRNGTNFKKYKATPILERTETEVLFRCGPWVIHDQDKFKMWYIAGSHWDTIDKKQMPVYNMRYMESDDGITWPDTGKIIMDINHQHEHGLGRPAVYKKNNQYYMHYSIRKRNPANYTVAFATSTDGITWDKNDAMDNFGQAEFEWESISTCFAAEINSHKKTWLLYNGNDFGRSGVAIAEKIEE